MKFFLLALVLLSTGCSSLQTMSVSNSVFIKKPNEEVISEAPIGETMYEESDYKVNKVALVLLPINHGPATNLLVKEGRLIKMKDVNDGRDLYCGTVKMIRLGVPSEGPFCFEDTKNNGTFDRLWYVITKGSESISEPPQYNVIDEPSSGYKQELIYQGKSGNVVNILYREYTGNLVREAFSQNISYTLEENGPTKARFKGLTVTIYSVDNNGIKYSVSGGIRKN